MSNRYVDQPQRRVVQTRKGELIMEWNPNFANHRNDLYNRAQRFVDAQVLYKSEDFIPVRDGELIQSGRRYTKIGAGVVMWQAEHARPVYYGHRARRHVGKKITRAFRWFARMKRVSGRQIVDRAKIMAGGGNG